MQRSFPRTRLLVAALAPIAVSGMGFVAATAFAGQVDPVDEVRRMHADMHGMHAGPGGTGMHPHAAEMDQVHAEMSARLSPEDRARHERMHEACGGLMTGRGEG